MQSKYPYKFSKARLTLLAAAAMWAGVAHAGDVRVSQTQVVVEHVTVSSSRPYADVKRDLEGRLGRLDEKIRGLLRDNDVDGLRAAVAQTAGKDGLIIHYVGVHGDWLIMKGKRANVIEYFIGNVLSAVEMTSVNYGSGLYAPLRIVLYENSRGGSTIEYDRPSTQLSQYRSAEIDDMGRSLDERLAKLCASALGGQ
jgi:uncharacterized protein (DUF302 family)